MNKYLAKSNPVETIQEHTDKLIENLNIFKRLYPKYNINWSLIEKACLLHDLGKMNLKFQEKIVQQKKKVNGEIAHNLLSLAFLDKGELRVDFTDDEIKILAHAIAYHHERGNYDAENLKEEIELLNDEVKHFKYLELNNLRAKKIGRKFFNNDRIYEDENIFYDYIKVKGLLNRLDYAASAGISVEVENNFLEESLEKYKESNFGDKPQWNELQVFMMENSTHNLVVVAQTGMGKTEAGLLWIGNNKGFFTLPLKTAINEIYNRITKKIVKDKEKVGLLHSDTVSKYIENNIKNRENGEEEYDIEEYYTKTKQLSLPITICTLDQLFDIVFKYRGFESKLLTMSYSKIVIDEIQMYSPDILAFLIMGLSYITKMGGKFAILTATLPEIVVYYLKKENIVFEQGEKAYIDDSMIRHSVKVLESGINSEFILNSVNNNKILVICNTVKKAKELYKEVSAENKNVYLLHSKFTKADRTVKEKLIFEFGQKESKDVGIWIATQVVEASLDIDFDVLITELSDINGLLQRMGRCYRKREFKKDGYNCFVFNGGEKKCSGVGTVIDKEIHYLSKEALKDNDGILKESKKLELIKKVYTTKMLEGTKYKEKLDKNINYIKSIQEYEKAKKEVDFRNIESETILPKCIYNEHKDTIKNIIESYKEIDRTREEKRLLLMKLNEILINVPLYEVKNKKFEMLEITKNYAIKVYDGFTYNSEIGLEMQKFEDEKFTDFDNFI